MIPFVTLSWCMMVMVVWCCIYGFLKWKASQKETRCLRIGHFQNQWTWRTTMSWRCSSVCPGSQNLQDPQDPFCSDSGYSLPCAQLVLLESFRCLSHSWPKVWGEWEAWIFRVSPSTAHLWIAPSQPSICQTSSQPQKWSKIYRETNNWRIMEDALEENEKKHRVEAASHHHSQHVCWSLSHIIDRFWPSLTARSDVPLMDNPHHLRSSPARVHQLSGSSSPVPISTMARGSTGQTKKPRVHSYDMSFDIKWSKNNYMSICISCLCLFGSTGYILERTTCF